MEPVDDMQYTINESHLNQSSYHNLSESKNVSEIVNDGILTFFDLFKREDKVNTVNFVVTFVLSLTEQQLDILNEAMISIKPSPKTSIQQFDLDFQRKLTPFQFELFKKSKIWTLPKESYLSSESLNPSLTANQKRRILQNMQIRPENLYIIEHSSMYNKETLEKEKGEDLEFMNMIQHENGTEILN